MSLVIRIKGANFRAANRGFYPDVVDGLRHWYFFGGSLSASQQDYAKNGGSLAITSGTYSANSARSFTANTPILLNNEMNHDFTMIVVKGAGSGNSLDPTFLAGCDLQFGPIRYPTGMIERVFSAASYDNFGSTAYYDGNNAHDGTQAFADVGAPGAQNSTPRALIMTNDHAGQSIVFRNKCAASDISATSAALPGGQVRDYRNTNPFLIKSYPVGGNVTVSPEIYMFALYDRKLTLTEQASIYAFIKGYYDRRSVSGL